MAHNESPAIIFFSGSLMAQSVKNPPAMQETQFRFLGQEDPLEKEKANPLQYSCLESPMDRGAWQVTDHETPRVGHDLAAKPPLIMIVVKGMYELSCQSKERSLMS